MVDPLLNLNHNGRVIVRMSVNPQHVIQRVEFGTSNLENRVKAINKLKAAGYKIGILIAPIILVDNWKELYEELIIYLKENLSEEVKKDAFFELIFMTYSYVHKMINSEAFPNAIQIYDETKMQGRGRGKYMYKDYIRQEGETFFREKMQKYFPDNSIEYIV